MGKLYGTAQPHADGGTVNWTTYTYDVLGRTTRVTLPDGGHTDYL
jgi:YD repeat-containing protein